MKTQTIQPFISRRAWLATALGAGAGAALLPTTELWAQAADFLEGPPVADIKPEKLSEHVWYIYSKDGFPTQENRGMMANVTFVVTSAGVVVLDTGASLQIGRMAIRMIKTVTDKPVVAVFNSHVHGDHWLGNHAFAEAYGNDLPIYALQGTMDAIKGAEGNLWRSLMERWTNQSTAGTKIVAPNRVVANGQVIRIGDVDFKMHYYGKAHTDFDLSVQVVQDRVTYLADVAMENRIANIDDGSYPGTFKYYDEMEKSTGGKQLWVPGHGRPTTDMLQTYGTFLKGIWENCLKAIEQGKSEAEAKKMVMADPRVASRAKTMLGFDSNIGKYTSLAYLEAEKLAF